MRSLKLVGLAILLICSTTITVLFPLTHSDLNVLAQTKQVSQFRETKGDWLLKRGGEQLQAGESANALWSFRQALIIYRALKNSQGEGKALKGLGDTYELINDYQKSLECYQQVLLIAEEIQAYDLKVGSMLGIANARSNLATSDEDYREIIDLTEQALKLATDNQNLTEQTRAWAILGSAYNSLKDHQKAIAIWQQAVITARKAKDINREAHSLIIIGGIYAGDLKNYHEALNYYEQGLKISEKLEVFTIEVLQAIIDNSQAIANLKPDHQAKALEIQAIAYTRLQNFSKALEVVESFSTFSRNVENKSTQLNQLKRSISLYLAVATVASQIESIDIINQSTARTLTLINAGLILAEELDNLPAQAQLLLDKATAEGLLFNHSNSLESCKQALSVYQKLHDKPGQLNSFIKLLEINILMASSSADRNKFPAIIPSANQVLILAPDALKLAQELNDSNAEKQILSMQSLAHTLAGFAYIYLGDAKQSELASQQGLELAQQSGDLQTQSLALLHSGIAYAFRGEIIKQFEAQKRSIEIARQISPLAEVQVFVQTAQNYSLLGDVQKSNESAKQALAIAKKNSFNKEPKAIKSDLHKSQLESFHILSTNYQDLGEYEQALMVAGQYLQLARTIKNAQEEASSLLILGKIYSKSQKISQAIEATQQAWAVVKNNRQSSQTQWLEIESQTLIQLSQIYSSKEEYAKALKFAQQALKSAQEENNPQLETHALEAIAIIYDAQGDLSKAFEIRHQSVTIARKLSSPFDQIIALFNLAAQYMFLGDYTTAQQLLQEILVKTQNMQFPRMEAVVEYAMAFVSVARGETQQAVVLAEKAAARFQDKTPLGQAFSNLAFSMVYGEVGDEEKAISSAQASLAIARKMQNPQDESAALSMLASLYRKFGKAEEAIKAYQSAFATNPQGNFSREYARLGRAYADLNQPQTAIAFYKQSINEIEGMRIKLRELPKKLQTSFLQAFTDFGGFKTADIYRQLADLLISQGRLSEAEEVLALLKEQEIKDFTQPTRSQEKPPEVSLNDLEKALIAKHGSLVEFAQKLRNCGSQTDAGCKQINQELNNQIKAFNTEVEQVERAVKQRCAKDDEENCVISNSDNFRQGSQEVIQKYSERKQNTLVISPLVLDKRVWILVAADGNLLTRFEAQIDRTRLGNTILKLRQLLENPRSDVKELQALSHQLYTWLIAPIEKGIIEKEKRPDHKITNLVFALDRVTRYIPMGVLFDGKQYLADKYTLSTVLAPETTDLNKGLPATVDATRVLAVGISKPMNGFSALSNVPAEINAIVRQTGIYPGTKFLDEQFTRTVLEEKLPGHQILHVATHAEFVSQRNASFLLLGDGRLPISEIRTLGRYLRGVHLVVLSACKTALGSPEAEGIEIPGISSYFLNNGAKAVIASLWSVDDSSTSLLMQQFYKNLATGKMTKTEALREAQLSLLQRKITTKDTLQQRATLVPKDASSERSPVTDFSHPYYWAPFILIGNGL